MILEEASKLLSENDNIISLIDLSLYDNMTEKEIHDQLKSLHKIEFNNNERIVFYCFSELNHKFNNSPAESLIQLQKMLVYVDISNFFCVIITNNGKLQQELNEVCKRYTNNDLPIKTILYKG